jgi:hypothetical protein
VSFLFSAASLTTLPSFESSIKKTPIIGVYLRQCGIFSRTKSAMLLRYFTGNHSLLFLQTSRHFLVQLHLCLYRYFSTVTRPLKLRQRSSHTNTSEISPRCTISGNTTCSNSYPRLATYVPFASQPPLAWQLRCVLPLWSHVCLF